MQHSSVNIRCRRRGQPRCRRVLPAAPSPPGSPGRGCPFLPPESGGGDPRRGRSPGAQGPRSGGGEGGREEGRGDEKAAARLPLPHDGVPARPAGRRGSRRAAGPLRRRRRAAWTSPRQLGAGAGGRALTSRGKLSNNNSDAGCGACAGLGGAPARPAGLLLFMWGGAKMAGVEAARRT